MIETLKDKTAIVGVGHTEYSKDSGRSEMSLAVEAILKAISDAGLKPSDIDGIAKYTMDNNSEIDIAANLGIPALRFFGEVGYGGGGGPVGSVVLGAMAVATGMANCVVAFRAMNERSGRGPQRCTWCECVSGTVWTVQSSTDGRSRGTASHASVRDQE